MLMEMARTQTQADTAILVASRDGFDLLAAAAHGVVVLAALGLILVVFFLLWQLRSLKRSFVELQRKVEAEPIVIRARSIAENVEFMTRSVRGEVERMNESVASVSQRVTQASELMEERIEEFNALIEVVQSEAEETFVNTASTVRGVRAGAERLRTDGRPRSRPHGRPQGEPTRPAPPPHEPESAPGTNPRPGNEERERPES